MLNYTIQWMTIDKIFLNLHFGVGLFFYKDSDNDREECDFFVKENDSISDFI